MLDKENKNLHVCKKCKASLSEEIFYHRKGYQVDSYCKKCRSEYNRNCYKTKFQKDVVYVAVTQIEAPELRLEMVRAVHAKVQEMVKKNQRKRMEEESKRQLRYMKGGCMARIKKKGLDYFPMDVEFVNDRRVWWLMKREGDAAFTVLTFAYSCLYSENGYYLQLDDSFCEDLADRLFRIEASDVRRILTYAVELGLFDARLFSEFGILTSADIQRQYLFVTKRRSHSGIDEKYNLLTEEPAPVGNANPVENVAETGINVTETAEKCTSTVPGYTKHSIAKHTSSSTGSSKPVKEWTKEDIDRLEPPADGQKRNFEGLKDNLRLFHISVPREYSHRGARVLSFRSESLFVEGTRVVSLQGVSTLGSR